MLNDKKNISEINDKEMRKINSENRNRNDNRY